MKSILIPIAALVLIASLFAFSNAEPDNSTTSRSQAKQVEKTAATPETQQKSTAEKPAAQSDEFDNYLDKLLAKDVTLPEHYKAQLEAEAKIKKALSRRMDFGVLKMPLNDVVEFFRQELGINIQMDKYSIEDAGGDLTEIVTFSANDIMARSAVNGIFRDLEVPLTWLVEDEVLLITTFEEADMIMTTKFYDVADLALSRSSNKGYSFEYITLLEVIKSGCDENVLWEEDDGEGGTMSDVDRPGIRGLVIRQTREVHEQIEVILSSLRKLRRKEPTFFKKVASPPPDPYGFYLRPPAISGDSPSS